jgi:hypothetical protein
MLIFYFVYWMRTELYFERPGTRLVYTEFNTRMSNRVITIIGSTNWITLMGYMKLDPGGVF